MAIFSFQINSKDGTRVFQLESGSAMFFLGANGGGKTRLAIKIEQDLGLQAHRISAQRALNLNPAVAKISEETAINGLLTGLPSSRHVSNRNGYRWGQNPTTILLSDFDYLLQVLFADQGNKALATHKKARLGQYYSPQLTNFERLQSIWEILLPIKKLDITGDDIKVINKISGQLFDAKELSDGERAIFYLIGQTLCALQNTVLIIDEPEVHVHRSIMSRLWDELEASRPDCAFIFISHDLEFMSSRTGQKYVIREFTPPDTWEIEEVPEGTGFPEQIVTEILGSRRPVLFVEGTGSSLDLAIYRACFSDYLIIPRGSCHDVIHSVVTMRKNDALTRITCSGLVDADSRSQEEIQYLNSLGISVLKVSEIENLFLLPIVAKAIGRNEKFDEATLDRKINDITEEVIARILNGNNLELGIIRYCKRKIDNILKKMDLGNPQTVAQLNENFANIVSRIDVAMIENEIRQKLEKAIVERDLESLLSLFDNKGFISIVAKHMRENNPAVFRSWIIRVLTSNRLPDITAALRSQLPAIEPV